MGVRILHGAAGACFYDSVTMTGFGPVCEDEQQAEDLLSWWEEHDGRDPRLAVGDELHYALDAMLVAHEGHDESCSPLCADGHTRGTSDPARYVNHARCCCDCAACACPGSEEEVR